VYDTDGGPKKRDAYEAIWLHVMGGALNYAPAVYKTPIVMRPEALSWRTTGEAGVDTKRIGEFPHRGLTIRAWRIASDARHDCSPENTLRFLFATTGDAQISGAPFLPWTVVRLQPGERSHIAAVSGTELIELCVTPIMKL
jgi:hypothetical protein